MGALHLPQTKKPSNYYTTYMNLLLLPDQAPFAAKTVKIQRATEVYPKIPFSKLRDAYSSLQLQAALRIFP